MKRIFDKDFKYVPASKTDIAATFRRIRREQKEREKVAPRVVPIKRTK